MHTQNIMFKQILASVIVNVPLRIPDVSDIPSLQNIPTNSASKKTRPPTSEHLHRILIFQNKSNNQLVTYKKYLIALIKMVK